MANTTGVSTGVSLLMHSHLVVVCHYVGTEMTNSIRLVRCGILQHLHQGAGEATGTTRNGVTSSYAHTLRLVCSRAQNTTQRGPCGFPP